MKKFTKGALIVTLVLVILGAALCAIGVGIGFRYHDLRTLVRNGVFELGNDAWAENTFERMQEKWEERWNDYDDDQDDHDDSDSWNSAQTENFNFSKEECASLKNLYADVYYGTVIVEEKEGLQGVKVEVKYRKANHERNVKVEMKDDTFKISETGHKSMLYNDVSRITVQIPNDMKFTDLTLKNSAGTIESDASLEAENIQIQVDAGECDMHGTLRASERLYAQVGAGEIDLNKADAGKLELNAGVGEINVENAKAENVKIDCGIGSVSAAFQGREEDYSYLVDCGVGEVEIGQNSYSGLGSTRKVENAGTKKMEISCGVGEVEVEFLK